MRESRGVYAVSSLDRLEDLRRMVTSLWNHNRVQVQVMLARDWVGCQQLKAAVGRLTTFDRTVMLDTDVYVKGDIGELFSVANEGKLGMYKELRGGPWNSGVMVVPKELGMKLSREWEEKLEEMLSRFNRRVSQGSYMLTDQAVLNVFLEKYPMHPLGGQYNYIIQERTLEDEARDWDEVKIHHFIHKFNPVREACRAYQEWLKL